ncbi:sensor domain-containing diguanylate cyclase [Mangrovibacillus cuniculi]|uniref:Diguanylate cyclase n=1 Tax=Mangrovibacillus cuniculi TaxID=2593652 RepID=A0A7S8CDK7_9BACI|nr:diguanylate cyclase [Mangrovibacillus cuniculi]QPC47833.1 diguanylate cyclase [Mangrovibacillus cuniculi]
MYVDLFINICIIVALAFTYLQLRWRKLLSIFTSDTLKMIDGLAGATLGIILMNFSIAVTQQTIIDLRFIPVMLLMIFVGLNQAMISTILIVIYRFYLGANASAVGAAILLLVVLIGYYIIIKLMKDKKLINKVLVMLLHTNITFTVVISVLVKDLSILKELLPTYWVLSLLGGVASVFYVDYLIRSQELMLKYKNESTVDFLTGLNNVRAFDLQLNNLMYTAEEKKEDLSILMIDIDYFKKVNDTYGHKAGDLVLAQLGEILRKTTRSVDTVSRNGGEEFSVLLPDCHVERAEEIAERIRETVEAASFTISDHKKLSITISVGVSSYPQIVENGDDLVRYADQALYKAKRLGRNRVCIDF